MKAEIKSLHSPDVDLVSFRPTSEEFCFLVQVIVGPKGEKVEESFDIQVCSPKWIDEKVDSVPILVGCHYLIMKDYTYDKLKNFLTAYCDKGCVGKDWNEVAQKLSRLGHWEFEDYKENKE